MQYFNENDSVDTVVSKAYQLKHEFFVLYKMFNEKSKLTNPSNIKMYKSNAEFFRSIVIFMNHWESCLTYEPEGKSYKMDMTNKRWRRNLYISYADNLKYRKDFEIPSWLKQNDLTQEDLEMIIMEFGE